MGCSGNCVLLEATDMRLTRSVFLRDSPETLFLYGTTDVIVGTVVGENSVEDNDFNARGEYTGGPDGCAVDFETSATGFVLRGNTFYESWGAGVMVFGAGDSSHSFTIADNAFIRCGCSQAAEDSDAIAIMCPGGAIPSGTIANNSILTCPAAPVNISGVLYVLFDCSVCRFQVLNDCLLWFPQPGDDGVYVNPAVVGCGAAVAEVGNVAGPALAFADEPQLVLGVPPADSTSPAATIPVHASCATPNVTLRYTVDGSRPSEASPEVPADAGFVSFAWPGPNFAFNVRAFPNAAAQAQGARPSVTNGLVVERRRYRARATAPPTTHGAMDAGSANATHVIVRGWAVRALDGNAAGGGGGGGGSGGDDDDDDDVPTAVWPTVNVTVSVGAGAEGWAATVAANEPRPDLVVAGVAPDPNHGFTVAVPLEALVGAAASGAGPSLSSAAATTVFVNAAAGIAINGTATGADVRLVGSPQCICDASDWCSC